MTASRHGHRKIVQWMLENGADCESRGYVDYVKKTFNVVAIAGEPLLAYAFNLFFCLFLKTHILICMVEKKTYFLGQVQILI